jgi:SSS family solute:Na+ symporter
VPKWLGCLVGGAVATAYFSAGGLLSSARVNAVQLVVMLLGFAIALPLAVGRAGGLEGLARATAGQAADYWSPWQGGASGFAYLALLGPAFVVSPGLLQKVYGARDERAVRLGVGANALALSLFAFVPPLFGMAARALHPGLAHHELALPTVFMQDVPPLIGALGLAAVVSAEVSTVDAILFMLATSLSRDLYVRFVRPGASDAEVLRVARGAALLGGAAGVLLALLASSVIDALGLFYKVLSVSLFVPVVAGLYVRRVGKPEVWAALGAGGAALLAAELGGGAGAAYGMPPVLFGILASVAAALVVAGARRFAG